MNIRNVIVNGLKGRDKLLPEKPGFNCVDLVYWRPENGGLNFGDHLSRIIVSKILADSGHHLEEETSEPYRLLAIGSILHFAKNYDVVWGSGVNGKIPVDRHNFNDLDVRAVRGPLTRQFLIAMGVNVPEVFGDPALLLPVVFPGRFNPDPKRQYVIVPNLHDLPFFKFWRADNIISPYDSWNKCITRILEAELVIASSLHGLIVAEAYGIPARYVRLSETENLFKYNDYVMGTGRGEIEYATSIEEAREMGGMEPPVSDAQKLLDAFPSDLWNKHYHAKEKY